MHCHSGVFVIFCMRNNCCGCCQNKQDGGRWISSLRRKTGWVFANFLEWWLHYKVNNHPITKSKPIYPARKRKWKGSVEPRPFIGLLILGMINQFIFGHGVVIYYTFEITCTYTHTSWGNQIISKKYSHFLYFCFQDICFAAKVKKMVTGFIYHVWSDTCVLNFFLSFNILLNCISEALCISLVVVLFNMVMYLFSHSAF